MSTQAFGPRGKTYNLAASDTASAPVQIVSSNSGCYTMQFVNVGSKAAYFSWGTKDGDGKCPPAEVPQAGSSGWGVPVLPNEIVIYNLVPEPWISVVCASGESTNLLVTPGEGM